MNITYERFVTAVTPHMPKTTLDRASAEEAIHAATEAAWQETHDYKAAFKANGRSLPSPETWRRFRDHYLNDLHPPTHFEPGTQLECGSIYDSTAGKAVQ
jgi:hypothetical protein